MPGTLRLILLASVFLLLPGTPAAQQADDTQTMSLRGLRHFAVHARVQLFQAVTLEPVDEALLREKIERAIRREGMVIQDAADVRNGSAAQVSLVYLVIPIRPEGGKEAGFAASSCVTASQYVRLPRQELGGRIAYTVAPTWSSCSMMVGARDSYTRSILRNAEGQIERFLNAWRSVNSPRPAAPEPILQRPA